MIIAQLDDAKKASISNGHNCTQLFVAFYCSLMMDFLLLPFFLERDFLPQ
jgi:hypothetical protein